MDYGVLHHQRYGAFHQLCRSVQVTILCLSCVCSVPGLHSAEDVMVVGVPATVVCNVCVCVCVCVCGVCVSHYNTLLFIISCL